jgi:hypothetical protein
MTSDQGLALAQLGFKIGINGPHAARTMMLEDVCKLFNLVDAKEPQDGYADAILNGNVLAKPTKRARELALRYLKALYVLDQSSPMFRALRRLWEANAHAQPLLALAVALARDPLLRSSMPFVLGQQIGSTVTRDQFMSEIQRLYPDRFSPASLKSFAQNLAGTWTSSGLLQGHRHKVRAQPNATPEAVTLLLFLGYLEGRTGSRLFQSEWIKLLGLPIEEVESLASSASHRGLLVFMNAGGVKEIRFPGYLTPTEEQIRQEVSHVL